MSTRRARIKAVTSLPPRRKNTDKPTTSKNDVEKALKSPKTPRSHVKGDGASEKPSPAPKPPPGLLPLRSASPMTPKAPFTQEKVPIPRENRPATPKVSENISVITSVSKTSVFASPQLRRDSPDMRRITSPITPRLSKNVVKYTPPSMKVFDGQKENKTVNTEANKSDIIDDYNNVPSVPESVSEDGMDGIIPLQPTISAPKPIDQLKNEIISENAEVLFDPIVPLPSPSKVRPKLRPAPRLGPHRRNSIQGSASESEDESRRALLNAGSTTPAPPRQRHDSHTSSLSTLISAPAREMNRIRNDSVCSGVSQLTSQPPATSPIKEQKHVSRSRRQEMSRRMSAMRRRHENVQKEKLTMYDLIFYNPTTNPIVQTEDEIIAKEANQKEAVRQARESDEKVDDPPETEDAAPVPQIKLGPNGEIVIDEQSLVIKRTESQRKLSSVVHEGAWSGGSGRYTRAPRTGDWSAAETVRFYRALAALGTDFTLMAQLFPDRKRKDMYLKFKKEEKINGAQVDKALRSVTRWDVARLTEEFAHERADEARRAQRLREVKAAERERVKKANQWLQRQSRSVKALESSVVPHDDNSNVIDDLVERALNNNKRGRRRKTTDQTGADKRKPSETESTSSTPKSNMATLTLINSAKRSQSKQGSDLTISRINPHAGKVPISSQPNSTSIPANIQAGSLVVLQVNDPNSPTKKMLQTYISKGPGQLTPVALPPTFLNSVIGYMKKGKDGSSPQLTSPSSVGSQDSRTSTPSVIQTNPSPAAKRQRIGSYNITSL
ncbi:uncharacterized protein Bdp1 [Plodia interpunctella]|uniref:uncharacterized protein Bdp1 n=1 Tax=Plodia interpunctella TaxID=58824 RepID=UPI0023686E5F|nr:uncharacterized protein LOC128677741 [Plodia interpunctella]